MMREQEQLARLQVLVAIARADGEIQPWERTLLTQAIGAIAPASIVDIEQLLNSAPSLNASLAMITTPELQKKTYEEAIAFAQLDGMTPLEHRLLEHIRSTFNLHSPEICGSSCCNLSQVNCGEQVDWSSNQLSGRSLIFGMRCLLDYSRQAQELVFDYALGAAIIGLIPVPNLGWLQLVAIALLLLKMMRDIGAHWGFPKGRDLFAIAGNLFGGMGALAITLMAWLTMVLIGLIFPPIRSLSGSAAYFTLTWTLGQATNQFYINSSRLDVAALRRVSDKILHQRQSRRLPQRVPFFRRIPLPKRLIRK